MKPFSEKLLQYLRILQNNYLITCQRFRSATVLKMLCASLQGESYAHANANVPHLQVSPGMQVAVGTPLVMVEAMKMEHAVVACVAGKVGEVLVASGQQVAGGQLLLHLDTTLSDKTAQPSSV